MVVALKSMTKKNVQSNHMIDQLMQEIKIQSYIAHPNVLRMYGFFSDY